MTPEKDSEIVCCCMVMLIGTCIFGYIIGNVTSLITHEDECSVLIREKITAINSYMNYRHLSPDIKQKIRNHFEYSWKRATVFNENEILQELPTSLRTEVALFINSEIIQVFFSSQFISYIVVVYDNCLVWLVVCPFPQGAPQGLHC